MLVIPAVLIKRRRSAISSSRPLAGPLSPFEIASAPACSFQLSQTINPIGTTLTDGLSYTFPSIELAPGQRVVVAQSIDAFQLRYGTDATPIGEFETGRLSNAGENLTLMDGLGQVILDFTYGDNDPWPERADGDGGTLEIIAAEDTPSAEYGKFWRWQGSSRLT